MSCLFACGLLTLAGGVAFAQGTHLSGAKYLKDAKVSLVRARAIALKACHGKIVSEELEKERGGSGLRYSFDVRKGKVLHEVGVDAKTGKVLENSIDNGND
ncbi:MAG TPA: PepSY domain-containing protein [Rhodanobacteraceae bacterium]